MVYELPVDKIAEGFSRIGGSIASQSCNINDSVPWIFWLLLLILLIRYKDVFVRKFFQLRAKGGYIRVLMRLKNMHLKPLMVKLDVNNNFKHKSLKDKMYALNNMHDYIIGYDNDGFPVFFYDEEFMLPWQITAMSINEKIRQDLNIPEDAEGSGKFIRAITMRISSGTLRTVYNRKLMSDIYNAVTGFNWKWILIIGAVLVVGYISYTNATGTP